MTVPVKLPAVDIWRLYKVPTSSSLVPEWLELLLRCMRVGRGTASYLSPRPALTRDRRGGLKAASLLRCMKTIHLRTTCATPLMPVPDCAIPLPLASLPTRGRPQFVG